MYLDAQTQICTEQAFTDDAVSENTYDCGVAGRDIAEGEPMALVLVPTVAAKVSGGTETYEFQVINDDDEALGSATAIAARTIAGSALTVGSKHVIPIPAGAITLRYLGMNFNGSNTPTITLDAWIMPLSMAGSWKAYTDNVTIQ